MQTYIQKNRLVQSAQVIIEKKNERKIKDRISRSLGFRTRTPIIKVNLINTGTDRKRTSNWITQQKMGK